MRPLRYEIAITQLSKIGEILGKRLIAYTGSAEAVFREKKHALAGIPGLGKTIVSSFNFENALSAADKQLEFNEKHQIQAFYFLDQNYPFRLSECEDAPIVFYQKGNVDLNADKILSVVGTRHASTYGKNLTNELISDLKSKGHEVVIISGMAFGIDAAAHVAALKNELPTVAILGHGFSHIYPTQHRGLAAEIVSNGALVTDFLSHERPERNNFVKRNRLIAALTDATVVVESAIKGGALITAEMASSYNRDVFAFPGNIGQKYSEGCNKLIKSNRAALIESALDLEYIMGWESKNPKTVQKKLFTELCHEEEIIMGILKENGKLPVDLIIRLSKMAPAQVSVHLLSLEMNQIVRSLPGNVYEYTG